MQKSPARAAMVCGVNIVEGESVSPLSIISERLVPASDTI